MTKAKRKGTACESMFVQHLRPNGFPHAERLALQGGRDRGDTTGHPGLVFECKSGKLHLGSFMRETEVERINAGAEFGILVHKPDGLGRQNVGRWHAYMLRGALEKLIIGAEADPFHWLEVTSNALTPETWLRQVESTPEGLPGSFKPSAVSIKPKTVTDQSMYRALLRLDVVLHLLRRAGFGSPHPANTNEI